MQTGRKMGKVALTSFSGSVLSLHPRTSVTHSRCPSTRYVPAPRRAARVPCPGVVLRSSSPGLSVARSCDTGSSSSLPPLQSGEVRPRLSCRAEVQSGGSSNFGGGGSGHWDPPPSAQRGSPCGVLLSVQPPPRQAFAATATVTLPC